MSKTDIVIEAGKAAPPAAIVAGNKLLGIDLPSAVAIATLLYLGLQICYLIWKWLGESAEKKAAAPASKNRQRGSIDRRLASTLALSAAGLITWFAAEGFSASPYIPTKGDVATIGHGSTRYEDGTPVKLTDQPITRQRAEALARNLSAEDEGRLKASIPGVALFQHEYDAYVDFIGQFGIGNWRSSSMRRQLLAGNHRAACDALLRYRFSAGYDCSTPGNKRCFGVWIRQQQRHQRCLDVGQP